MRTALLLVGIVVLAGCAGPTPGTGTPTDSTGESPTEGDTETTSSDRPHSPSGTTDRPPTASGTRAPTDGQSAVTTRTTVVERVESIHESGRAAIWVHDANEPLLAIVNASVAQTRDERFRGLSDATSLPDGTGMLFVYPDEDDRTFVMRDMAFPLDMVFVGANGTITTIHHAPVEEDDDLREYVGRAKWVLEVPYGWTTAQGVEAGDAVEIEYPPNVTVTPDP